MKVFYNNINQLLDEDKPPPSFAIAVSGGADSMALALLCREWSKTKKVKLTALIVNHGLRAESLTEVKQVKAWLGKRKIDAVILTGKQPLVKGAGLQERAREYRYRLLIDWCKKNNVSHLLLAHHADDQRETILMRLVRGSGVDGMAGMYPSSTREGIKLLRPLLTIPKRDLVAYLQLKKQQWIEDPTNQSKAHTRNRLREVNAVLEEEGLTPERLQLVHANFARTSNYLHLQTCEFLNEHARFSDWGYAALHWNKLHSLHEEILLRTLKKIVSYVNADAVEIRIDEVLHLLERVTSPEFKGATLGHVEFIPSIKNNLIYAIKERKHMSSVILERGGEATFDGRYHFTLSKKAPHARYIVAPLGAYYKALPKNIIKKHQALPKKLLSVLPALFHLEEMACQPHIDERTDAMTKKLSVQYLPLKIHENSCWK